MNTECMMVNPRMNSVATQIMAPMPGLPNIATELRVMSMNWRPHETRSVGCAASTSMDSGSLKYASTKEPVERTLAMTHGNR